MGNLIALILVIMVIVLGVGACWAITANGAATASASDSFGNTAPVSTINQNEQSSSVAVGTMSVLLIPFIILICVLLVSGFAWLWATGKSKASKY